MKKLKAEFEKNCMGCELCVIEAQKQLGKVGLEGAPIRVFKQKENGKLSYEIDLDPSVNELDIEKIKNICPTLVFTIDEGEDEDELTG